MDFTLTPPAVTASLNPSITGPDTAEPVRDIAMPNSRQVPDFYLDTLDAEETQYQDEMNTWRRDSTKALDAAVLDPKAYTGEKIPQGWTPDEWRQTRAVDDFFRLAQEGQDPPMGPMREFTRAKLATQHFGGAGADSDAALYTELTKSATTRKDQRALAVSLETEAFTDAMLPEGAGWAKVREKLKATPGYDPQAEADYYDHFQTSRRSARRLVDEFRNPLESIWATFHSKPGMTGRVAYDVFASVPEDKREDFMTALAIRAKTLPEEERRGFWANMAKATGETTDGFYQNIGEAASESMYKGGTIGWEDFLGSNEAVAKRKAGDKSVLKDFTEKRAFARQIRQIEQGIYDPTLTKDGKTPGFWEGAAYQTPGVVATSLTMAVPYVGLPAMYLGMKGGVHDSLATRFEAAGMDTATAETRASELDGTIALLQTGLEKVGFSIWSRKLPGFTKALDAIGDKVANRALRLGMKTAIIGAAETGVELAQDVTEFAVQDIAASLSQDVPEVDWESTLGDIAKSAPEIFVTMLPLSIMGAAGGLSRESQAAAWKQSSALERRALGISDEASARIDAAQGPSTIARAVDEAWAARTPATPEAQTAMEELRKVEARKQTATAQLENLGYAFPTITARPDGNFSVFDGITGEEVGTARDLGGVQRLISSHTAAIDDLSADATAELATLLLGGKIAAESGAETEFNLGRIFGQADAEAMGPEFAERWATQTALLEQAEGGTGDIARTLLGMHTIEIREGQRQIVNQVFSGATLGTIFHEQWHGKRREAHRKGIITRADDIAVLRGFDQVLGDRRLGDRRPATGAAQGEVKATGRLLRFIPAGLTDEHLKTGQIPAELIPAEFHGDGEKYAEQLMDEGIAELAEMEIFRGHAKSGKNKFNLPRGVVSTHIGAVARLDAGPAAKFKAFINAMKARFGLGLARAFQVKQAEKRGEWNSATYDAYVNKIMGVDEQVAHDAGVRAELTRIMGMDENVADDDIPFSLGRATVLPPTTQKSRTIAGPALEIGNKPVQEYSIVSIRAPEGATGDEAIVGKEDESVSVPVYVSIRNPENRDDLSPRGDGGTDTAFSLGKARENYERAKKSIPPLVAALREAERNLSLGGGSPLYNRGWEDFTKSIRQPISDSYVRPLPGVEFIYNGKPAVVSEDNERVVYGPGLYDNDPVGWIDARLITQELNRELIERIAQAEADLYLAEEEFDPQSEVRQQEAEQNIDKELERKRNIYFAMLAARDEEAKNAARSFVAKVWNAYAKHNEIFQYGKTTSKDIVEIARVVSTPGRVVTVDINGGTIRLTGKNGYITIKDANSARPYISAPKAGSAGKKEGGGSQLYVVALDWIHNNGKRIKDDVGLTSINYVRRTSNFLASAIRWGTTKHLKPHEDQKIGKWTKNDVFNTSLLATKEMENVHKAIPETRGWTFSFASGKFLAASGEALTESDFIEVVEASDPETSGIGVSTLQRGIITASAIQEFQRGTSADIVESAESDLPGDLRGVSYSLGPAQVAGRMAENATARIADPRRRAHVMSRIARDFAALCLSVERLLHLSGRKRSKAELRMEANAREDLAAEEKISLIHSRFGNLLADDDLVKIKSQPVHAFLADPDSPLRGRLMSKAAAIKAHPERYQLHRAGEYDGADGISRSVFGGTRMPDQAAQELYDHGLISEPTPDAMWEALGAEQNTVAGMKELLKKAQEQIREAKREAKQEANDWLATQSKDQETHFSPKEEILRSLRMYDAIMLAMPAEVRGQMGGYTQMAMINTDEARLAFLKDKLAKADKLLESWLRVEFDKEFRDLLRRATPDKNNPGERPAGKIAADAYDILREAEAAMGMDFVTGETRADMFDALADHEDAKEADIDKHRATAQMIRLTSNWHHADAARREQALIEGDKIYFGGLQALAIENSRRRERLGKLRQSAINGTGKTGHPTEIKAAKRKAQTTLKGGAKEMAYELLSFGQLVNVIFGEDSTVAKWFNEREIAASNASFDGMQVKQDALETLFQQLSGSRFGGEKLQHRMSTQDTVQVTDVLGVDYDFTEAEAIQMLLEYRQNDGKRHYQGITDEAGNIISNWAWDDASMATIESQLTSEGQAVMAFLGDSYGTEYGRINEVFRKIWHVSMPRHKMYAPIASIRPVQAKADTIMDPSSGETMGAGMTPGSLKNRSSTAVAQPQATNAFQVYLSHARQMEHFIAYGEFARDAMAIVNRREAKNSIEAAVGPNGARTLSGWLDLFALGGIRDANMGSRWQQVVGNMLSRASQAILVGRVSVLAMQSLQLGAAAFKMPVGSFLARLAKLHAGKLSWKEAMNSPYIQRRLAQMPPVVRDMAQGLAAGSPTRAKFLSAKMGQSINGADALFTGGTYAIFYDYHLGIAKKRGVTDPDAYAHKEAERLTDQVAQPTRMGARSWLEVKNQGNPFFRTVWNFSTDPRQKLSIPIYEMIRHDVGGEEKAKGVTKALVLTWAVAGVLQSVLRTVIRDMRGGDDDEIFDERHWSLDRLALQALGGPLGGLPLIGGIIEDSSYKLSGQYMPGGGIWSMISNAAELPHKWSKGKVDPLKDAETLASGLSPMDPTGTAAFSASVLHAIRDAVGIEENFTDD